MLCETHTRAEVPREHVLLSRRREVNDEQKDVKRKRVKKEEEVDSKDVVSLHSPTSFLESLRHMSYEDARAELLKFQGVGPKVAE